MALDQAIAIAKRCQTYCPSVLAKSLEVFHGLVDSQTTADWLIAIIEIVTKQGRLHALIFADGSVSVCNFI